jgi:hypothetical protein
MEPPMEARSIASCLASADALAPLRRRKYEKKSWVKIYYPVTDFANCATSA